jgi:hypothetical protein
VSQDCTVGFFLINRLPLVPFWILSKFRKHLQLKAHHRCCSHRLQIEKIKMALLELLGPGEDNPLKNLKLKISWHCPFRLLTERRENDGAS